MFVIPSCMNNSGYPATYKNMMPVQLPLKYKETQTVPVQLPLKYKETQTVPVQFPLKYKVI